MSCSRPVSLTLGENGQKIKIGCGDCDGCRLERLRFWLDDKPVTGQE